MTGITISIGFFHFIRRLIFDRGVARGLMFDRGVARGLIFDRGVARIVVVGHIFFHYSLYFFISNSVYCDFYLKLLTLLEHSSSLLHFDEVSEHLSSLLHFDEVSEHLSSLLHCDEVWEHLSSLLYFVVVS
jgi:hypothetical protein